MSDPDARTEFEKWFRQVSEIRFLYEDDCKEAWNAALEVAAHVAEDNDHPYSAKSTADRIRELKEPT